MLNLILQAVTRNAHATHLSDLLGLTGLERAVFGVAFLNSGGVALIEDALQPVKSHVDAFVGIRNDVTSAQGLKQLLPLVNRLYYVDTGSRHRIFHPKLYLARSRSRAELLLGSANLTTGGLWNNIEASVLLKLDMASREDNQFVSSIEAEFDNLPGGYPSHVVQVRTPADIDALLASGRVVDESLARPPTPRGTGTDPANDPTPRMALPLDVKRPAIARARPKPAAPAPGGAARPAPRALLTGYELVWESKELSERDLNIPTGANTARTGSMLFKQGRLAGIDQRHYFRVDVFPGLTWSPDSNPRKKHLERAQAKFRLVIRNVDYGEHELKLTHNSDKKSAAYRQSNAMTQVHWGPVAGHIRRRTLLGRTLSLFRSRTDASRYIIEID